MLDILQASFWSITYVLLVIYAIKYKMHGIPLTAICLNYGWETVALIRSIINGAKVALVIHIAWFVLDSIIVALFLFHENRLRQALKQKLLFLIVWLLLVIVLFPIFENGGMLLSCFTIDLIMAVAFLFFAYRKEMIFSPISITIGITKFIGDLCAWIYYKYDPIVNVIGIIVLICNLAYIFILSHKFYFEIKNKNRQEDEI